MLTLSLRVLLTSILLAVSAVAAEPESAPASATRETLAQAIKERRIVTFLYQGHVRTVEPHVCGVVVKTGEAALHGYQTDGESASGIPPGWRTFSVAKITDFKVGEKTFAKARAGYAAGRPRFEPVWAEIAAEKP